MKAKAENKTSHAVGNGNENKGERMKESWK